MENSLHKSLQRQLNRFGFSLDVLPDDINKWKELIKRVNQAYRESDQERYLLERSMEISSAEMKDLNSKLEESQHMASLGYWYHNTMTKENIWSKELYKMFKLDFDKPVPTIDQIFDLVHEQDREKIKGLVSKAFNEGQDYETEIRMKVINTKDDYHWYHIIGRPRKVNDMPITELAGVAMDITKRKIAEEEVSSLQRQLMTSARRAGMADVATSILHNVGNVLNSVNVSINLISEYIKESDIHKLLKVERMMMENEANIAEYLTQNEKGKLIPKYLLVYTEKLQDNVEKVRIELRNLTEQIGHIKTITEMQKSLSGVSGVVEKVYLPESIDTAIKMCGNNIEKSGIAIIKNFEEMPFICTDNSKLIQILVNLINNAKDALLADSSVKKKSIIISIKKISHEFLSLQVKDNGIGIEYKNLTKIFSFGFTTKTTGHGFGLHSSALAAKELGGKLEAHSDGPRQGALFELTLPLHHYERRSENESEPELASHHHR
ncbi:Sensor protein FixL [Aquicella siphonis]|uniref:histidine kinase n=1 Tax=Aquicella siphonis TaxID=254247 RepID=A0A5E4PG43_9COXI|nr:PAS domain-containing sensor histidine kinase [Aquicella siphonis]VVC75417.1 Sensor protein FixL [Aquicella siphonis]